MMEPLVLMTDFVWCAAFLLLKQYAISAVFLGIVAGTAWLCRRHDERRFR